MNDMNLVYLAVSECMYMYLVFIIITLSQHYLCASKRASRDARFLKVQRITEIVSYL